MIKAEGEDLQKVESYEDLHTRPVETNSSLQAPKDEHLNSDSQQAYTIVDSNRKRKIKRKRPETVHMLAGDILDKADVQHERQEKE